MLTPTISRQPGTMRRHQATPYARAGRKAQHAARRGTAMLPGRRRRQSPLDKALSRVMSGIPAMAPKKTARDRAATFGKRAGTMALIAGGVGLAVTNRDKLMRMMNDGGSAY